MPWTVATSEYSLKTFINELCFGIMRPFQEDAGTSDWFGSQGLLLNNWVCTDCVKRELQRKLGLFPLVVRFGALPLIVRVANMYNF